MMKLDRMRYFPVGYEPEQELQWTLFGLIASTLCSLIFPVRYFQELQNLYRYEQKTGEIISIASFPELIRFCFVGFWITALLLLIFAAFHYFYHFQGSHSIYLMRRLPGRWELARRCLAFPLAGIAACALAAGLLLVIYAAIYVFVTPERFLHPSYGGSVWRSLIGGPVV